MAIQLVQEVLDHAPDDITPAELVVLLAIAERASNLTRVAYPSKDGTWNLARRCRLTPDGLRRVFQRLAARGLEVRVSFGVDGKGRPVYACRGRSTDYRLPKLPAPRKAGRESHLSSEKGGTTVRKGGTRVPAIGPNGGTLVPPRASLGTSGAGVGPAPPVRPRPSPGTLSPRCPQHQDTTEDKPCRACAQARERSVTALREATKAQTARDHDMALWRRWRGQQPDCDHGYPGGDIPEPHTGTLGCPFCRRAAAA